MLGLGAVAGFTATFIYGSPEMFDVLGLVVHSLIGGVIFGVLGYFLGSLLHRFVVEEIDKEIKTYTLAREMRRQKRRQAVQGMKLTKGINDSGEEVQADQGVPGGVASEASAT